MNAIFWVVILLIFCGGTYLDYRRINSAEEKRRQRLFKKEQARKSSFWGKLLVLSESPNSPLPRNWRRLSLNGLLILFFFMPIGIFGLVLREIKRLLKIKRR